MKIEGCDQGEKGEGQSDERRKGRTSRNYQKFMLVSGLRCMLPKLEMVRTMCETGLCLRPLTTPCVPVLGML